MVSKIEMVKVADIHPYAKNPRMNAETIPVLVKSIQKFGFKVPIVLDDNNEIVCGHTRWKAARELGLDEVPCVRAEGLTKAQLKAYRIADNKVAEIADWDKDLLKAEISDLEDEGCDLADFFEAEKGIDDHDDDFCVFTVKFYSEKDHDDWFKFMGWLKRNYPQHETLSAKILQAAQEFKDGRPRE